MRLFWSVGAYSEGEDPNVCFVVHARIPNALDLCGLCQKNKSLLTIVNSMDWTTNNSWIIYTFPVDFFYHN